MNKQVDKLSYLDYLFLSGEKMQGAIRTKELCKNCKNKYSHVRKLGYVCRTCNTKPNRFFIDLGWQGKRIRLYSDSQGQALDTYQRALILQARIHHEVEEHVFDPGKYVKAEQEKFYTSALIDKFRLRKLPDLAPSYVNDFSRYCDRAKDFFKTTDVRELRKIDILEYKEHLEKSVKGKTLKNYLDAFKTFLYYQKNELEIISQVPPFPNINVEEYKFKWLGQEDQIKLFELVPDFDKPIISFLILHGCRPGEARALKCKDVDLQNQTITISATWSRRVYREKRKGKKSKSVTIPIHSELRDFVIERVKNNLPEAYVFTNPRGRHYSENKLGRIWRGVKKKAGITDLKLKDATRHSFASQLVNSNTSLFKVSKLLGHSSIKMTEKYAHGHVANLRIDIEKLTLKKKAVIIPLQAEIEKK